jgi:serine/threonine protein kinase
MGNCVQAASQVDNNTGKEMRRNTTFHTIADEESLSSRDCELIKYSKKTCALEYWEPISFLGDGGIATVYLVRRRPHRVKVPYLERADVVTRAQKVVSEQSHGGNETTKGVQGDIVCAMKSVHEDHVLNNTILRDAKDEITILSKLSHPNMVRFVEGYERQRHVYMIMEVCNGGDLQQVEGTNEQQAKEIVHQILGAVAHMHAMGIVHRDLKPSNCLFTNTEHTDIKIIDFGMAAEYSHTGEKLTKRVGTIFCMAPEVLKGAYDNKCDMVRFP